MFLQDQFCSHRWVIKQMMRELWEQRVDYVTMPEVIRKG